MSRKFLYRRLGPAVIVILALVGAAVVPGSAQVPQLKRPQQDSEDKPAEDKKPKKKVKGPRAVGLLQLNSSGKGSLIPIAIQVEGKFYDASAYKADPVPMALESGTVYEVEQSGSSQGLFTISGALHNKTAGSAHPWTGAGSYLPNGTEAAKTTHKAENVPLGMDTSDSDAPPRLSRGNASKPAASGTDSAPPADAPAGAGSSGKPAPTAPPSSSPPAKGGASGSGSSTQNAPQSTTQPDAGKPSEPSGKEPAAKPTDKASPDKATPGSSEPAAPNPTAAQPEKDTYYRPTLRRGKPTQPAPEEEEPASKAGKTDSPGAATSASTSPLQFEPAISDAGGPEPRSYKFYWKTGEEDERRGQMMALAADEVRAYAKALAKNFIPAKPPAAKAAVPARKAAAPAQPVFENTQFRAFDVWGNNQPVMILTAQAHLPPAPGATTAPETYSITLVARTDIYGNLRKVYSGVTDRFHLDVTPKLELIDAVDADGDGRGELLFRETTDAGSGYVIYRPTADKLWKMFDSLGG
jgi:hypothetical protein